MTAVVRGDALHIPLRDESVDLAITSPPYFALRSYRDECDQCGGDGKARPGAVARTQPAMSGPSSKSTLGGSKANRSGSVARDTDDACPACGGSGKGHYDGQIGSEPTPQAFLEALWAVTAELWRVLKPSGSLFVNLGDKRAGSGGHNNSGIAKSNWHTLEASYGTPRPSRERRAAEQNSAPATRRNAPNRYNQAAFGRTKSKMLLPHRYAIGCEDGHADPDGKGWIVRSDIVWSKPNGLPESVRDRVRDSHEYWFHLTKQGDYFSAVDEIREAQTSTPNYATKSESASRAAQRAVDGVTRQTMGFQFDTPNPLGKLPGSVWTIGSEPLTVPDWLGVDHFAAFPQEWPRRLILGWSPSGICVVCGEGRRPVVDKSFDAQGRTTNGPQSVAQRHESPGRDVRMVEQATITGYACACTPYTDHPGSGERHANTPPEGRHGNTDTKATIGTVGGKATGGPWREYHFTGWQAPPTRPAVILDPFGGTGTVAMVARALGRTGISLDLSADYCRLARWRIFDSGHASKTRERTNRAAQGVLL